MVLGKLPVPGRPANLDFSRTRAYCTCSRCGWGCLDIFFSRLSLLSSFSLFLGDGPIKTGIPSQRAAKPKTTDQPNRRVIQSFRQCEYQMNADVSLGLRYALKI